MKFLSKRSNSTILKNGLVYRESNPKKNQLIRKELLIEQFGFCAYSEKFLVNVLELQGNPSARNESAETIHVEHFDPSKKNKDDYFNYYAVCGRANEAKIGKVYLGGLFFQDPAQLNRRIIFKRGVHSPIDESDPEAQELIDFLGFDEPWLTNTRKNRMKALRNLFIERNKWDKTDILVFFREHRQELSFPTAIEAEFNIDLTDILQNP